VKKGKSERVKKLGRPHYFFTFLLFAFPLFVPLLRHV
jgi:hypothetical protein